MLGTPRCRTKITWRLRHLTGRSGLLHVRERSGSPSPVGRARLAFLERLRAFTVLDPACGSGNFLYLALHALHDVEHQVQLEAETLGLQQGFPSVDPANVKGIELNAYAM